MPKPLTVLVSGATGQQGGAVARLLLEKGHRVRALTRRPGSPAAESLRSLGAEIVQGDLEDGVSVQRAADGADGFFLVTTPFEKGAEAEVRGGRRAAEAAKVAAVKHLVYSSAAGADRATGVAHFESKREVERHLVKLKLPHTIVAPVFFMENLLGPALLLGLRAGKLSMPLPGSRKLQMVALADIAGFVRLVLERSSDFEGKRVELASDSLAGSEMAELLAHATGSPIGYAEARMGAVRARGEDLARMWEWIDRTGFEADVEELRRSHPEVGWHSFGDWVREQDWSVLDEASPEQPTA